jgi:TolB-like protein
MRPGYWKVLSAALAMPLSLAPQVFAQKVLADGIKDLASQIAGRVAQERKTKVAVLPFKELQGQPTVLGTYIAEELVTALFEHPGFSIVERTMLDKVVGELKLDQTGLIDPETAKRVGRIAGVDAIVTGTITDLASYVSLNARLIDAQTGQIFAAAETRIVKDDDVRKIMAIAKNAPAEVPGRPEPNNLPTPASKPRQVIEAGFVFDLKGCKLLGTTMDCDFLITNRGDDRDLTLFFTINTPSRVIDDAGNEYQSSGGFLATSKGGEPGSRLVSGIPVRARASFEHVRPEVHQAALLELSGVSNAAQLIVQFRNVPILRP